MAVLTIVPVVLILGLLILIHVLGHVAARRALFGGDFVDIDLSFAETPPRTRMAVVMAGPAANFLAAVLLFWGLFALVGRPGPGPSVSTTVGMVKEGFPAAEARVRAGDRIVAVNHHPVGTWDELARQVSAGAGRRVRLTVERGAERFDVILTPRASARHDGAARNVTVGLIGVVPAADDAAKRVPPLTALGAAARRSAAEVALTFRFAWVAAAGADPPETDGGPILIARMAGEPFGQGMAGLMFLAAVLSINVGVLNLLPLPFLDGERLCFLAIELLRGEPVSLTGRRTFQGVVILLLAALALVSLSATVARFLKTL